MHKAIFGAVLAGGVVLVISGIGATQSPASDVSRLLTGSPTAQATVMLMAGVALAMLGVAGLFHRTEAIS